MDNEITINSILSLLESTFSLVWSGPNKLVKVVNEDGNIFVHFATSSNAPTFDLSLSDMSIIQEALKTGYFRQYAKISGHTISIVMATRFVDEASLIRLSQYVRYLHRYYTK